jgi:cold shock CspA family protein/ribosome-associated translation inhibitor RaiA
MAVPLEINLRGVEPHDEALRAEIERQAAKLGKLYSHIMNLRVVVEAPPGHKKHGRTHKVSVEVLLPQKKKLVANREHRESGAHEEVTFVVREAFEAAKRQLEEHSSRQRPQDGKSHEAPPHGTVSEVYPDRDFGYITSSEGHEVYFHRNSVVEGGFENLSPGDEVRFSEERGEKGPQASTVHPIGKHHIVE